MYLKSVELQGFKSFADKIYLDFNPGITAIVGPNGSGKSNISDAIRWVMGEQSVKSLRGSRMEDVIFSGTEVRKPQGFAEVSLVLDNSEHIFPVDYEEVTVTRRVYRSGEGEYFINKNSCRLKDIHELFMDTGLGREGYSIVGQGKIDEILSNKSEDRRRIFEEAAGITKYKYRKNDAEKKLERTQENLTRVTDIMTELEGQIEPLRVQSEKARKYLNLRDALKVVEVNASVASIEKYREDLKLAEKEYDAVSESIITLQKGIEDTENAISKHYADIEEYDKETENLRIAREKAQEETSSGSNSINLSLANIEHFNENIARINQETGKCKNGIEQLDSLIENYNESLRQLDCEEGEIAKRRQSLEAELEAANSLLAEKSEDVEELKAQVIDKTSEITSLHSKIANYNILLDSFSTQRASAEEALSKQSQGFEQLAQNNKRLKESLEIIEAELADCRTAEAECSQKYNYISSKLAQIAEKKNSAMSELSRKTSKKSVLEDMENEFEGFSRSVKSVMTAHSGGKLSGCKIYGPLSGLVSTDKKYVTAIEVAMASVSQNIVAENEQDAKAAIKFLKDNRLGRATFMPISTVKARSIDTSAASKLQGFIALAKDLVKYDDRYSGVVGNVLGATVVVDHIDNAISMAAKCGHKFRIVTLDGEVMQAGGAMTGGSMGKGSGFLSRRSEIDTLSTEILKIKSDLAKLQEDYTKNTGEMEAVRAASENARQALIAKNEEYAELKAECEHSDKYLSEAETMRTGLLRDIETAKTRTGEIHADIDLCKSKINALEGEIEELRCNAESRSGETEEIIAKTQELQEKILNVTIEENAKLKDIELQRERLSGVMSEKTDILAEIEEKKLQIQGFSDKIDEINKEIKESRKRLGELGNRSAEIEERIDELSKLRRTADSEIRRLQDDTKDTRDKLFALGQQKVKAEAKKAGLESDLDSIFTHLWEEYELTYTEALKVRTEEEINLTEANREIASLKSKIKALGNINIDAIEEYKNVKERFDFLTEQTRDLEKAKAELEGLIDEMLDIMKKQFSEQFAIISKNFNQVFRELFGGGQATLSLADPDDILESGVEIEAQPPGKKLQSLTLLSGGERAFTAIALLFAILKVRPTPFCILDEIEAALDDVNVYRYADYLKKYSNKTQFIVVTHRRGTMEAANILYGVTMQEKGVSKLLSLNIDEVTEG